MAEKGGGKGRREGGRLGRRRREKGSGDRQSGGRGRGREEGERSMVEGGKLPGKVFLGLEVRGWVCTPVFFLTAL